MTNEELNEWLAIHIMGYEKLSYPATPKYQKPSKSGVPDCLWSWNPCEDIAQTYAVMDEMLFRKMASIDIWGCFEWCVKVYAVGNKKPSVRTKNSSLPLAICTAIYEAMKEAK